MWVILTRGTPFFENLEDFTVKFVFLSKVQTRFCCWTCSTISRRFWHRARIFYWENGSRVPYFWRKILRNRRDTNTTPEIRSHCGDRRERSETTRTNNGRELLLIISNHVGHCFSMLWLNLRWRIRSSMRGRSIERYFETSKSHLHSAENSIQ